ncbi:MAG: triose-phosphate isomerase [Bacteroidetes bacterium]|nr:MAG: triose-phosphate isomerase [Bacteroidota bacterium]
MRKRIVAGNWKMNLTAEEAVNLFNEIEEKLTVTDVDVRAYAPSIYLQSLSGKSKKVTVGAQNFYPSSKGAFTGEISPTQLRSIGINTVLIGHSERRDLFGENNEFIHTKVKSALENELDIILCCGESLETRDAGNEVEFVTGQLSSALNGVESESMKNIAIAYEPIWAIGTGRTATSQQAEDMHLAIRNWLVSKYGSAIAESTSILYGGSCNAGNAKELFACPNVDGGLIGGASLDAEAFLTIISSY